MDDASDAGMGDAGMGDAGKEDEVTYAGAYGCLGNAGRDAGRQVPAGGCRSSVLGPSCQEKPPGSHPTHSSYTGLVTLQLCKHNLFDDDDDDDEPESPFAPRL